MYHLIMHYGSKPRNSKVKSKIIFFEYLNPIWDCFDIFIKSSTCTFEGILKFFHILAEDKPWAVIKDAMIGIQNFFIQVPNYVFLLV